MMKKIAPAAVTAVLTVLLACTALTASAGGSAAPLTLPDLVGFSDGTGSVYREYYEDNGDFVTYGYQCATGDVEAVVQEYIRALRKAGIFIWRSEKTVYDEATNDANYGIALRDSNRDRARFTMNDPGHGWEFRHISVYIAFSTGGNYVSSTSAFPAPKAAAVSRIPGKK